MFVPDGGVEPAEEEIDGDAHDEVNGHVVDKVEPATAVGLKRKTSGDEGEEDSEAAEEDQEAKRVKV